jgi:hypothetical protein
VDTTLVTKDIWRALTAAAKKKHKSAVAVAYFGDGAAKLLPIASGSTLVVDAGESTVKGGQTCPSELKKLQKRGVRIYTRRNLHAKVFVFGPKAFIGSSNASHNSGKLHEAVIATTDRRIIAAARQFVLDHCIQSLGPERLSELEKMYRPPRVPGGGPRSKEERGPRNQADDIPRVRIAQCHEDDPPAESKDVEEAGRRAARKRMEKPRSHELDEFWWEGNQSEFLPGEMVVQVTNGGSGRVLVSPPGTVVGVRKGTKRGKRYTFVFVEVPKRRRTTLSRLAKRIGRGAKKRLSREGQLRRDFAERLLRAMA